MVRLPAPGWFCTITVGLPGMCLPQMALQHAGGDVVAGADVDADHDADGLALVEIGDALLRQRRRGEAGNASQNQQHSFHSDVS